jgi:hypothetical protein
MACKLFNRDKRSRSSQPKPSCSGLEPTLELHFVQEWWGARIVGLTGVDFV